MPKWVAEEKAKKKKEEEKKTGANTKPQSSSVKNVNKKASNSTFMGGGSAVKNVKSDTKKGPSEAKKREAAANASKRAAKSTFMGGTETTPVKRATTKTTNNTRLTSNTTAAQRQKMGMPTQQDLQSARASRKALATSVKNSVREATSDENKGFMQRQKSGTLTTSDKKRVEQTNQRRAKVVKNTGAAATKAVQDTVSGYGQTLADVDELAKSNRNWTTAKAQKMGIDLNDRARVSKVEQERQQSIREAREFRQELFDKQEQRQAEWDERTKNAKGLEKAWYGAVESGTGMLADTLVGAATGTGQFGALASMGLRTYGPSANQARKEGATDKEARLYGLAQSGKEIATELMFQGAGLAKAAYGKTGLSLADKSANILTKGLTGLKADAVGAGVRALGGTTEENVEELAGWMADPLIKELTYGKAVRNRMKENLRANIPQIGSDADAANVASYFSTPQFTDELTKEYVKSGMSKDKASELAAEMRDYYVAYYSGDQGKLEALEEDLAAKLSGQDKLSLKSWSMDELKDTFASTTLLTLATGLPGAVTTSVKGNQIFDSDEVKAVFGNDAVRKVADAVKNTSNKEMSLKAETMKDRLDSGKDLTGTQKFDLYQGYLEKVNETAKKARASYGVVENVREEQDLVPTMGRDRTGNTVYAKRTQQEYNEKFASTELTVEAIKNYMESDNSISDDEARRANAVKKAVSDLHVGGLTVGDAHEFAYGNDLAREALKAEEGIDLDQYVVRNADGTVDLAATNEATENALFKINADNAIRAAQAETEVFIDDTRGNIDKDLLTRFGNNGQAVWKEVNKDLDPRDLQNYLTTANAAAYFYSAGRNTDMSVDSAINRFADTFKTVDNSVLKRAFAAGARDRIIANTPGYGQTVTSGSNIQLKKTKPIITGQLIMDKDVVIPDSDQSAYLALAMSTNTNIHIVSDLNAMGKDGKPIINQATGLPVQLNGMSHGNDIYLNMNEASEKNLGYVFMHEMTHKIKQYAPNEYLALENLVRDRWFNKDAAGMQKAIKDRIDLYSTKGGQQLTEEEAVEEIIADAMAEAMDDPEFAAQVCEEDINLGQAILNSIRAALRSIRQMFANIENPNDRFHNSLLSYLGILDEAEKMWLNALATAKQNKADGLIADWQDKANGNVWTEADDRFSIVEDPELIKELEADDHITTYRGMVEINGKYYSPMSSKVRNEKGKYELREGMEEGQWVEADITTDPKMFYPDGKYKLKKDNGKTIPAAYNPYMHSSDSMMNDQFSTQYQRPNLVVVEGIIPVSEINSGIRVEHDLDDGRHVVAKDPAGIAEWKPGPIESQLPEDRQRTVYLSNHFKMLRKVPEAEVAQHIYDKLEGTDVAITYNVVTPKLREELQKLGTKMEQNEQYYVEGAEGYIINDGNARWTNERIDDLIGRYGASNPAYSQAYAVLMNPRDFLRITIEDELLRKWRSSAASQPEGLTYKEGQRAVWDKSYLEGRLLDDQNFPLDEAELRGQAQTPFLYIRSNKSGQRVLGHEGRHRMRALMEAGVTSVPVVIEDPDTKTSKQNVDSMILGYQEDVYNGAGIVEVNDLVPIKESNREELIQKFGGEAQVRFSITPQQDADYMNAVNNGNMDEAQRLVDEAARMAMPNTKLKGRWYHGTENDFTVFNFSQGGKNGTADGFGIYLTNDPEVASSYGNRMIEGYVNVTRPASALTSQTLTKSELRRLIKRTVEDEAIQMAEDYDDDIESARFDTWISNYTDTRYAGTIDKAIDEVIKGITSYNGNDMDIIQEIMVGMGIRNYDQATAFYDILTETTGIDGFETKWGDESEMADPNTPTIALAFRSNQIKSAEPVTYADDGSVIPLSERFDPTNNDIRYSLPTQDSYGDVLSDGQMEFFKNSQARNDEGRLIRFYHYTDNGRFTIFDPSFSDDHRSLFFTDDWSVGLTYTSEDRPTKFSSEELTSGNETARAGYYPVYLNLINPLIVDADNSGWNMVLPKGYDRMNIELSEWDGQWDVDYRIAERGPNLDVEWGDSESERFDSKEEADAFIVETFGQTMLDYLNENDNYFDDIYSIVNQDIRPVPDTLPGLDTGETSESTRQIAERAYQEGYDGVIFKNLVDLGASQDSPMAWESTIAVAFSSNQVKLTDNENPTENPDIRYSITDEDEAMEWLASQYELDDVPLDDEQAEEGRVRMAKSKKEFIKSKNALWNERWLTEGKVLNVKSVRKNIKNLVTGVMANSDTDHKYKSEVVDKTLIDAKSAYWLMKEGKHSEAAEILWNSAVKMIENVDFIEDITFNQYKDLRDYMRTANFRLGEEYWSDVDFSAFRKRNFGRIKLVKGETNIDQIYQELQEKWQEWFDEDEQMTAPDQLLRIEEVLDAIQPYRIAYSSEEAEQLAGDIADTLYDIVYQGEEYKSIADTFKERYDAKTKALKARHEEALAKVRARGDELLAAEKERTARQKERAELWKSRTFEEKAKRKKDKDVRKKAKYFGKISDNIDWLTTRLLNETKDKNIPEGFRRSLAHMLMQFDMQTEKSKELEEKYGPAKNTLQMRELKSRLEKIANEDDTGEFRYDGYLFYLMDALAEKVDGKTIDALDTEDLIAIDTMLKSIVHNFRNYNKIRLEEEKVAIANIGDNIIDSMDERIRKYGKRKSYGNSIRGYLDRLVNEGEETPIYFFERLDPTGQGIGAMYKELRRGEDRHIQNMNFLRNRFKAMFSDYFNEKKPGSKLEAWRDTSQSQTFNLQNGSITLNPAQIMSLYCLSKRPQAMGHILGAGIVASPVSFGAKMKEKFKGNEEQVDSVMITYSEVQEIIATLTEDQVHLADEMQSLMNNEMAAWGNETSLELHGIKLFRENDYFPIKSSNEVLDKSADKRDVNEKIKNFGFTKPLTRNANNAIMIDDIFSVVADHCNKMSLYNSMAIPITDFMRVYNYKQRREGEKPRAVQAAIGEAFTRKANDYIMKFISDVNGNTKTRSDAVDDLMNKTLANYKKASIGLNGRVALQQITAIFRARMVIDGKYFLGTKLISPKDQKEMFEHCPIALWKSWGHYDMDMGRDIEDIMMNNDWSKMDTVTMGVYGMLDNMAWGKIWQAVKKEVKEKHRDVPVGSDEFFKLCNERASEIYDKTQVVDSIFHRSDTMRSKNTITKMATSFMAEPTLTYNVFRDSIVKASEMMKDGDASEAGKLLIKMMKVLVINAAAVAASSAIWDVVRGKGADDDEDDENLMEKGLMALLTKLGGTDPWTKDDKNAKDLWLINFLNNFSDNAPWAQWNNIYFVKDIVSLKDGWGTSNMALEGWETLFKGVSQAKKKLTEGSDKSWYDILMNIAGGLGYVTGYPVKTFMRDTKAILEKFGIEVLAADGSDESTSLMDSIANKMGYKPIDKKGSTEFKVKDSFLAQLGIGKTEEEKAQDAFDKKTKEIADKYADLSGEERDKKVWSSVTTYLKEQNEDKGVADMVTNGDYATINKYRQMYLAAGGNAEYFDNRILAESKKALKKSIKYDQTSQEIDAQDRIKSYMINHGVTEQEISEIAYKSDTAKDMKIAFIINDKDAMLETLEPLVYAGLTYEDLERLWTNRNRIDIMKYKSSKGRYADRLKSTGKYIWPTDGVITSHFGYRNAPTAGASSNHPAIDIGAPQGTAVVAADGGVIIYAGTNSGYGNSVGIKHDNGMVTYYNHLYAYNVNVGDTVAQGQQIAQVGSTGISTGPHLDFKILDKNGKPVDPEKYLDAR